MMVPVLIAGINPEDAGVPQLAGYAQSAGPSLELWTVSAKRFWAMLEPETEIHVRVEVESVDLRSGDGDGIRLWELTLFNPE